MPTAPESARMHRGARAPRTALRPHPASDRIAPTPPSDPPTPVPAARERILEAAVTVFGGRGFRDATVREISREAGVGLGLMNYHFGDKESLYGAVLEHLFETAFSRYPVDAVPSARRPAAECLRDLVRAVLGRLIGDTGLYRDERGGRLLAMEMANPSPAMDEVIQRYIRP